MTNTFDLLDAGDREMVLKRTLRRANPKTPRALPSRRRRRLEKADINRSTRTRCGPRTRPFGPPGRERGARAPLLRVLASLRWVDDSREARAALNAANDPAPAKPALNCVVAFHRFFPQANHPAATSLDARRRRGRETADAAELRREARRFTEDWARLATTCRVTPPDALAYAPLPDERRPLPPPARAHRGGDARAARVGRRRDGCVLPLSGRLHLGRVRVTARVRAERRGEAADDAV